MCRRFHLDRPERAAPPLLRDPADRGPASISPHSRVASVIALILGIAGVLAIAILQALLLAGVLSFSQKVGPVTIALMVLFGGWLLLTGYLSHRNRLMPGSMIMGIVGWLYVGYPIWSFWLGRQLGVLNTRGHVKHPMTP